MRPEVTSSSPAIRRRRVDFPQPDGPTKTTNSPSAISRRSNGRITSTSPKFLVTALSRIWPIPGLLFHRAEGQTADKLLLAEPAKDQDGRDGQSAGRTQFCCSACNFDPQYQATSIAYRADRRATHAPNNNRLRTASAANSGPLSNLTQAGIPRRLNKSVRTSMTSVEESLRRTRIARVSREAHGQMAALYRSSIDDVARPASAATSERASGSKKASCHTRVTIFAASSTETGFSFSCSSCANQT